MNRFKSPLSIFCAVEGRRGGAWPVAKCPIGLGDRFGCPAPFGLCPAPNVRLHSKFGRNCLKIGRKFGQN